MIVRRLGLSNFKKFRDRTLEFAPGLNVVKGPNEAGKSTLHEALRMAFFQKPTATAQDVKRAKSWGAQQMFSIELEFAADGDEYRLEKDFVAKKVALAGGSLADPMIDPDQVQRCLGDWLGCPSEKFFSSTICVNQDEVARWDTGEMAGHLQKVVAGGDVAAREALKKLRSALQKLCLGLDRPSASNGPIKQTHVRLEELHRMRAAMASEVSALEAARETAADSEAALAGASRELAAKSDLVAKNEKLRELRDELAALQERYGARHRAKELHEKGLKIVERLKESDALAEREEEATSLIDRSKGLAQKREVLSQVRVGLEEAPPARGPSILVPAIGAIIMAAGIAGGLTITSGMYLAALAGGAILIFGVKSYLAARPAEAPHGAARYDVLEEEIEAEAAQIEESLKRLGFESVEDVARRLSDLGKIRDEQSRVETELKGAAGGVGWEAFETQSSGLATEIERRKEVIESLAPAELEPLEHQKVTDEVGRLKSRVEALRRQVDEAGYVIENTKADSDALAQIDDEISELDERTEVLEHRRAVYEAAIAGIEQAEHETMEKATDALQVSVSVRIARITGGRYSDVKIDEKDLSIAVRSDEKGDWADLGAADNKGDEKSELSRATRDQFYLAARLGLIEHLCGDTRPPLLLDDPFVTFDEERLARTMELLKEMAAERQVFLFTCHEDYDRFADHVVDLGARCEEPVS